MYSTFHEINFLLFDFYESKWFFKYTRSNAVLLLLFLIYVMVTLWLLLYLLFNILKIIPGTNL